MSESLSSPPLSSAAKETFSQPENLPRSSIFDIKKPFEFDFKVGSTVLGKISGEFALKPDSSWKPTKWTFDVKGTLNVLPSWFSSAMTTAFQEQVKAEQANVIASQAEQANGVAEIVSSACAATDNNVTL